MSEGETFSPGFVALSVPALAATGASSAWIWAAAIGAAAVIAGAVLLRVAKRRAVR